MDARTGDRLAVLRPAAPLPAAHYNVPVQITVIGAGVVGLAIAHELASRGATVRILDARGPGQGATWASAGILAPHIEGHSDALLRLSVASLEAYRQLHRPRHAWTRIS